MSLSLAKKMVGIPLIITMLGIIALLASWAFNNAGMSKLEDLGAEHRAKEMEEIRRIQEDTETALAELNKQQQDFLQPFRDGYQHAFNAHVSLNELVTSWKHLLLRGDDEMERYQSLLEEHSKNARTQLQFIIDNEALNTYHEATQAILKTEAYISEQYKVKSLMLSFADSHYDGMRGADRSTEGIEQETFTKLTTLEQDFQERIKKEEAANAIARKKQSAKIRKKGEERLTVFSNYAAQEFSRLHSKQSFIDLTVLCISAILMSIFTYIAIRVTKHITSQMEHSISTVTKASGNLNQQAHTINTLSTESVESSHDIATSGEEISISVSSMASSTEQMHSNVNMVSDSTERMNLRTKELSNQVDNIKKSADRVIKNAQDSIIVSETAKNASQYAANSLEELNTSSQQIVKFTKVIKSIAEQTNMLSLNAAIEAHAAGEEGKSFSILANEIKELAAQSSKAADDIGISINQINTSSAQTNKAFEDVQQIIEGMQESVHRITESAEHQIQAVSESAEVTNSFNEDVISIATAMRQLTSSAEFVTVGVGEIDNTINSLSDKLNGLAQQAKQSKIAVQGVLTTENDLGQVATELHELIHAREDKKTNQQSIT